MVVHGATANQQRTLALLRADLHILGVTLPHDLVVRFGGDHVADDCWGWHDYADGKNQIELWAGILGSMLYLTLLHEIGHSLGLNHYAHGVMASPLAERKQRLTLRARRMWLRDFMARLGEKRLEMLQ